MDVGVNLAAVIAATIASMAVGALWYSPVLFAKPWMKAVGKTEQELSQGSKSSYLVAIGGGFITAYVLAHFITYVEATTLAQGALVGTWAWAGFVFTASLINTAFSGKSRQLWLIEATHHLAVLMVMGAIIGLWQ